MWRYYIISDRVFIALSKGLKSPSATCRLGTRRTYGPSSLLPLSISVFSQLRKEQNRSNVPIEEKNAVNMIQAYYHLSTWSAARLGRRANTVLYISYNNNYWAFEQYLKVTYWINWTLGTMVGGGLDVLAISWRITQLEEKYYRAY